MLGNKPVLLVVRVTVLRPPKVGVARVPVAPLAVGVRLLARLQFCQQAAQVFS